MSVTGKVPTGSRRQVSRARCTNAAGSKCHRHAGSRSTTVTGKVHTGCKSRLWITKHFKECRNSPGHFTGPKCHVLYGQALTGGGLLQMQTWLFSTDHWHQSSGANVLPVSLVTGTPAVCFPAQLFFTTHAALLGFPSPNHQAS